MGGCPKAALAATREQAITATKIASSLASQAGALSPACRARRGTTQSWGNVLAGLTRLQPRAEGKLALEMSFLKSSQRNQVRCQIHSWVNGPQGFEILRREAASTE